MVHPFHRYAVQTVVVTLSTGERIGCTPEHPFFVSGLGWMLAGDLRQGMVLAPRGGPRSSETVMAGVLVTGVDRVAAVAGAGTTVYNFEVEGTHTYFVGKTDGGEWVHNGCSRIWSQGRSGSGVKNAFGHWVKHGNEFPEFQNALEYVEGAKDFTQNPASDTLTKVRPNGDRMFYNPNTNTFAVTEGSGAPKTMFRPTNGINYWNGQ